MKYDILSTGIAEKLLDIMLTSKSCKSLKKISCWCQDLPGPSPFGSMRVPGLKSWTVQETADVEEALERVRTKRHVASTALNERSSRSHTVISLSVQRASGSVESMGVPLGVLHIVDLAGSERTKVSQAEGIQMKEANCINRSLSALADVLFALGDSSSSAHVPYRNSKLTYLLQDALGGPGCKTFLFAQVSPDAQDAHESYSTLTFAARVATSVQKGRLRVRTGATGTISPSPRPRDSPFSREENWSRAPPLPRRKTEESKERWLGSIEMLWRSWMFFHFRHQRYM